MRCSVCVSTATEYKTRWSESSYRQHGGLDDAPVDDYLCVTVMRIGLARRSTISRSYASDAMTVGFDRGVSTKCSVLGKDDGRQFLAWKVRIALATLLRWSSTES